MHLGCDTATGQKIVVKKMPLIRFEDLQSPELKERFVHAFHDEFELLKAFQHKNLVSYLGSEISRDSLNIIQEFVRG